MKLCLTLVLVGLACVSAAPWAATKTYTSGTFCPAPIPDQAVFFTTMGISATPTLNVAGLTAGQETAIRELIAAQSDNIGASNVFIYAINDANYAEDPDTPSSSKSRRLRSRSLLDKAAYQLYVSVYIQVPCFNHVTSAVNTALVGINMGVFQGSLATKSAFSGTTFTAAEATWTADEQFCNSNANGAWVPTHEGLASKPTNNMALHYFTAGIKSSPALTRATFTANMMTAYRDAFIERSKNLALWTADRFVIYSVDVHTDPNPVDPTSTHSKRLLRAVGGERKLITGTYTEQMDVYVSVYIQVPCNDPIYSNSTSSVEAIAMGMQNYRDDIRTALNDASVTAFNGYTIDKLEYTTTTDATACFSGILDLIAAGLGAAMTALIVLLILFGICITALACFCFRKRTKSIVVVAQPGDN